MPFSVLAKLAAVVELLAAYLRFAKEYHRDSGAYDNMCYALKPLREVSAAGRPRRPFTEVLV